MYMFDENKNKVDVKVIKTDSKLTSSGSVAIWEYDAEDLEGLGIDDVSKYTVLAVNQQISNNEKLYAYKTDSTDMVYPNASIIIAPGYQPSLKVLGYFYDDTGMYEAAYLTCTVVLMRTEN